jgi:CheY-like chemotaxis protein
MPLERILMVEDESDIQVVARMALEAVGGFTVEVCSSGEEALRAFEAFRPDMVLLDVMMPGMDGPATLKAIRNLPGGGEVPIAFMTAKVMPGELAQFKELGALDVIAKPFDPMTLPGQVRAIWEGAAGAS